MINNLKNKKITVYVGSNSGAGVSNGNHGVRSSITSTITISGILFDFNDKFLHLKNTTTSILSQLGVDIGFSDNSKLTRVNSEDTLISLDQVLFINF